MQRSETPGKPVVLVVEDEHLVSWAACRDLTRWGYHAISAASLAEARTALAEHRPDIILLDIRLPDGRGLDLLAELPAQGGPSVIVVSAIGEPATIVEATKLGAADFLTKPCAADDLHEALLRLNVTRIASPKPATIYAELGQHGILSHDPHMLSVLDSLQRFARTPRSTVLISGETGTGKSLAARALHQMSARAGGPFVEINCAAVPETLLESELMGHERGAFTDARSARVGLIESANRGTLFLDEIGDMPLGMQ
ncbi:MAG: sigma-54-dependent Fis family transcriptional regulator, partial [Deltaproteobacteria bacterium]|nr:sigma-54-dependent Fis family transcriptional regulator [Deltaproteobacteria bacterium]